MGLRFAVVCAGSVLAGSAVFVAGCAQKEPRLSEPPTAASPAASSPRSTAAVPSRRPVRSVTPSPTGFSEAVAVPCNGRPSPEQVVTLLRRASVIPAGARPTVNSAPVCAGTWQYTVITLPESDPLHVVTRGSPGSMAVETAGTNPCTPRVRATAPAGILAVLQC